MSKKISAESFISKLKSLTPGQEEFHQAAYEVLQDIASVINENPAYREASILERLTEPDRQIFFRVTWQRDNGEIQINRGYRIQFNDALGPYKGGLRFHPSVNPSILKFLGFEQIFKNALTGLPMGGGKGGADLNKRDLSENEIRNFCRAYMTELYRHIGPSRDIPAGDIGVSSKEIGYLFGSYRKITGNFDGTLTGKGLSYGGSEMRTEATGYGLIHFTQCMLARQDEDLDGKTVCISGAGNVATYAAELAMQKGAKVISLSDSRGTIHDKDGLSQDKLDWIKALKTDGGSLEKYKDEFGGKWHKDSTPWDLECDVALPCATQNEMDEEAAKTLIKNGCQVIAEGANMPLTAKAQNVIRDSDILYAPGKASNAGGVAISGLEIWQNQQRRSVDCEVIAKELETLMSDIHDRCVSRGKVGQGKVDYVKGANIAGFERVAEAMLAQSVY